MEREEKNKGKGSPFLFSLALDCERTFHRCWDPLGGKEETGWQLCTDFLRNPGLATGSPALHLSAERAQTTQGNWACQPRFVSFKTNGN